MGGGGRRCSGCYRTSANGVLNVVVREIGSFDWEGM